MFSLAPIFSNGVILQAQKPVRIFGIGDGEISVTLGNETLSASSKNGKWLIEFSPRDYSEVCTITAKCGDITLSVQNATFGDVYLLAGQSNMQFKLHEATPDGDIYESDDIRLFSTDRLEDNEHFKSADGWVKCYKNSAPHFSAIGYFLARDLHKQDGRPIGLVSLYQGASVIQSWLSPAALDELNISIPKEELHWDHHHPDYSRWNGNSTLHNFALSQIVPFSFSAVLWYQGESNASDNESKIYDRLLAKMILSWREELCDSELKFIIIQIADYIERAGENWSRIQKNQAKVASELPFCSLAKCADICEDDNIHPPTKHLLAQRIKDML